MPSQSQINQQLLNLRLKVKGLSGGGVTDGDKGDVVVSGGGTIWAIDPAYTASITAAIAAAIAGLPVTLTHPQIMSRVSLRF